MTAARGMTTRAMATAMVTVEATMWVMVMVTRLAGVKESKGECDKSDGDDDEGGGQRRGRQVL